MKVYIVENYEAVSKRAAGIIIEQLTKKPNSVLGLATGSSPIGTYKKLIASYNNKEISFRNVSSYNLDEYCGLSKTHPQSYHYFMNANLFKHIDIDPKNVHLPSGEGSESDYLQNAKAYNDLVNAAEIDIQILGIGGNGHIGFNEPGTPFEQETFVVELTEKTRLDNKRFFQSLEEVPTHAITMGIKNIMKAKQILLLISGESKIEALSTLLNKPVSPDFPASILHLHPNVIVICDKEAYGK